MKKLATITCLICMFLTGAFVTAHAFSLGKGQVPIEDIKINLPSDKELLAKAGLDQIWQEALENYMSFQSETGEMSRKEIDNYISSYRKKLQEATRKLQEKELKQKIQPEKFTEDLEEDMANILAEILDENK